MKPSILAALVALTGCATTGHGGPRLAKHFTGNPYEIKDDGSRISGEVCGINIDYSVDHHGDVTRVSGFSAGSVFFEVRDQGAARHLTGSLGRGPATGQIDLVLTNDLLRGRAGTRDVQLTGIGDSYQGRYSVRNTLGSAPMVLDGRDNLSTLPPAELAALLPLMLNCEGPIGRPVVQGPVAMRFGGPAGYETRAANEIQQR